MEGNDVASMADASSIDIEVKSVDGSRVGIYKIENAPIRTPIKSVAKRRACQDLEDRAVRIDAIERRAPGRDLAARHAKLDVARACPEPPM